MRARESLRVVTDGAALADAGCALVLQHAEAALRARGAFHLALSGGSTPRGVYQRLARDARSFEGWSVWFGDERCVPPESPLSNFHMAAESGLLERLPAERVHRLRGEATDARAEARRYAAELCAALGEPPRLDLVLLGLGDDGHTASLFPGSPALEASGWVTESRSPRPPLERLTLTLATLEEARALAFLIAGPDKALALARALGGSPPEAPAHRAYPRDGTLVWLVDRAAKDGTPGTPS